MSNNPPVVIAIDGPSASGKSTVARESARALGFNYVDSGSLYRGLTWKCLREQVSVEDPLAVIELVNRIRLEFFVEERAVRFTIDGEDPGAQVRSVPVQERVSDVAAIPEVRAFLVRLLRETTRFGSLVMEGRDIGTVVFPDAQLKIYLDASPGVRAMRRVLEMRQKGMDADPAQVEAEIRERDHRDSNRAEAPLTQAPGAVYVDTSPMGVGEVVAALLRIAGERLGKEVEA